ncbi:MAG: HEAT repeat domain-containing protein [Promethearchaeota archaeon]|nr:MAG: HEAT repeat domain-containing protein [Candidatus Lokiarchaeota archaeon]
MSLKLEIKENYPESVKRYIEDYNNGIELQDIMEVNLAIDGLLQLVFHKDQNVREFAGIVLQKIADLQPGFLKKGVRVLLHRYKGQDTEKSEYASIILGLLTETKARDLIADKETLDTILEEHRERLSKVQFEEERKKEFLEKVKEKEINFVGISGEFLRIGQYYNKLIIDEDEVGAQKALEDLITRIVSSYNPEESTEDFEQGCALFSIIAKPENREPVVDVVMNNFLKRYADVKKKEKEPYNEFLINVVESIQDLLPPKMKAEFLSIKNKRLEEKKKESLEKIKQIKEIQQKSVNVEVTWEKEVKDLAIRYNDFIKFQNEKELGKCAEDLFEILFSKDPYIKKSSISFFSQLLRKNFPLVEDFVKKLVKDYKKSEVAEILEEDIDFYDQKGLLEKGVKNFLIQDKQQREEKERIEREKRLKELERIEKLKVEFSGDWDKRIVEPIEEINEYFINEKKKSAEKEILGTMKNYIYAEEREISQQAIQYLNNVAKKYPEIIKKMMKELLELFNSESEARSIAIDLLGLLNQNPNREILFDEVDNEFFSKLKDTVEERQEEIKREQLEDKWDAIKLDVTTIVIDLEYDKKIQKVCRSYNEGIKAKDKKKVLESVEIIVDWFVNEKDEDRLNQVIEVLGKIAKQNIELIAPAIDMFLKMVDSKDEDTRFRAIKGLGEVAEKRPGWAYMAIDKLIKITTEDKNDAARMKSLLELSRIGKANPTMLIEHISPIINALKDPNKHVRRLAAFTIGNMAEAIPLEAQEAIPALRDALHDEYHLVRMFADKALKLIRTAMRK